MWEWLRFQGPVLGLTCRLQQWVPGGSLLGAAFLGFPDAQPPAGLEHSFTHGRCGDNWVSASCSGTLG